MYILTYASIRIKRSILGCMALALVSFAFTLFICLINQGVVEKHKQLDDVYSNVEVRCVVSNLRGTQTDNLDIKDYIISLFLSDEYSYFGEIEEYPFSSYVRDIMLKLSLKYEILEEGQPVNIPYIQKASNIIGLTHISAESMLRPESGISITYFDEYTEAKFLNDTYVCIVSAEEFKSLVKDNNGDCYIRLAVGDTVQSKADYAERILKVAGTYSGMGRNIYCPWSLISDLSVELTGTLHADSLSCIINDNKQINTFKELLARHFADVDVTGALTEHPASNVLMNYEYAITVYDETFNKTVTEILKNIKMLEGIKPVIIILAIGVGFFTSYLFVHNRKKEFAVMRVLGTKKLMVFAEAVIEQLILGLFGIALGMTVYSVLYRFNGITPWYNIMAYLVCYIAGAATAVFLIIRHSTMKTLVNQD